MNKDQLAARLLGTFVGEIEEQVRAMNADVLALEADPADAERLKSLFRVAHTLKGAARAAAVAPVEQVCHSLETLLAEARDGKLTLGPEEFTLLFSAADALGDAGKRLKAGRDLAGSPLAALRDRLRRREAGTEREAPPPPGSSPPSLPPSGERRNEPVRGEQGNGQVRVEAEKLDALLAATGQLLVSSSRVSSRPAELEALHDFAARWAAEWPRTGRRLRLALERSGEPPGLIQAVNGTEENLRHLLHDSGRLAAGGAEDARVLSQATDQVADRVRRLRMRPFAEACEALPRAVRDLAITADKEVELGLTGGEVQVDRAVLDGLREALLHLVRNAVDHGIEPPAEREQAHKPRRGKVSVAAALRGDRLTVTVADDGAGLNVAAIRAQLARRGLPLPSDERELARSLFEGGLSTRGEVTATSGRGVGLDIVRAALERVRGSAAVAWAAGRGTTFTLECPPTLATIRALLAAVGPQILAVPTTHVERLLRLRPEEIKHAEGRDVIATPGAPVPLVALARLLPPLVERPVAGPLAVVLLRVGERRLAVAVDELLAEQEVVLRPVGRGRQPLPHVSGAAILGTGRVALVLDPVAVLSAGLGLGAGPGLTMAEAKPAGPARRRILVVDDSITTRTLEQSILEAAGYDVLTAVDGADAWKVLQERGCDLVVADIEMPRMDGFALCEAIRGSKRFKELPVVLVTALETPEHRARGLEVGADAYIGKSSFDQQNLLDTIGQLLG
ncbi:MAG: response regulator [Gemmatimonadetes bacterium]|nr:response regulator [Gemmatimonadota bacterium]